MSRLTPAALALVWIAWSFAAQGCKGDSKEKYAAAIAGTAASMAVIQEARSRAPSSKKKQLGPCCDVCDECSFPCGDHCVAIGTPCVEPHGCACYPGGATARDVPPAREPPPHCMQTAGDPLAPVVPVVISD